MKKIFILFAISIAFIQVAKGQPNVTGIPAKDAETFLNSLNADASDPNAVKRAQSAIINIVNFYSGRRDITATNLGCALDSMPFLKNYTTNLPKPTQNRRKSGNNIPFGLLFGGEITEPGGMDVTNIADGIAKFLIKRGKQELSMAFFDRFSDTLKKYPEIRYIFPYTSEIVQNIDLNYYPLFLQELKDAFSKDLLNIPADILSLKNIRINECNGDRACETRVNGIISAFKPCAPNDPRFIILPLIAIKGILDGNSILKISDQLATDPIVCKTDDNITGAIKLSAIILAGLKNPENDGNLLLNPSKLKVLFYSKDLLTILFGLLYQQYSINDCYKNLKINGQPLEDILTMILAKQQQFYAGISNINQINFAYSAILNQSQSPQIQKLDIDKVVSLTSASLNVLTAIASTIYTITNTPPIPGYDLFLKNMKTGIDICTDIQQKNYSGIFTSTIKLINDNQLIKGPAKNNTVKYLAFAANLASAANSEEVSNALETVALPSGSYSIKQKALCNITLNGFIGYAWDFKKVVDYLYAQGVYAPIGFTFSRTLGKKHGGSVSIFASLIDIGSIASYRLTGSATDTLKQQVRLESILSPSAQLVVGLPNLPFSFCAGWRMTPRMFFSGENSFMPVQTRSVFNLAILIDIPIFTIYNKSIY